MMDFITGLDLALATVKTDTAAILQHRRRYSSLNQMVAIYSKRMLVPRRHLRSLHPDHPLSRRPLTAYKVKLHLKLHGEFLDK